MRSWDLKGLGFQRFGIGFLLQAFRHVHTLMAVLATAELGT